MRINKVYLLQKNIRYQKIKLLHIQNCSWLQWIYSFNIPSYVKEIIMSFFSKKNKNILSNRNKTGKHFTCMPFSWGTSCVSLDLVTGLFSLFSRRMCRSCVLGTSFTYSHFTCRQTDQKSISCNLFRFILQQLHLNTAKPTKNQLQFILFYWISCIKLYTSFIRHYIYCVYME